MQIFQKKITTFLPYQFSPDKSIRESEVLYFDIETTGFSPDISSIYLIGCCYNKNNCWNLIQFFADDYISEQMLLQSFCDFAADYKTMIHFNGNGFDIPYLQKKLLHYNMKFSFDSFLQIDLYKKLYPYKKLLGLANLKQKTVEDFIGLPRIDSYSGGELIEVYVAYMRDKFGHKKDMEMEQNKLLLHNEEDVTNLIQLTSILAYTDLFEDKPALCKATKSEDGIAIALTLPNPIPKKITHSTKHVCFTAHNNHAELVIKGTHCELKYFYANYKDYYYLPAEDHAIHKSVAEFVDRNYRVKAKASTCYTRKTGFFIPQFHGSIEPSFRLEYKEKETYIECTDKLLDNQELLSLYASTVLQHLIHSLKHL